MGNVHMPNSEESNGNVEDGYLVFDHNWQDALNEPRKPDWKSCIGNFFELLFWILVFLGICYLLSFVR